MSSATVTSMVSNETATIEDAKKFVKVMGDKGKWSLAMTQYRVTALEAVSSMLGADDDHTARAVLANVDTLARDWARKNMKDGKTQKNYAGSVRSTLNLYLMWLADPAKAQAQFDAAATKPRKPKAKPAADAATSEEQLPLAPPPAPTTSAPAAAIQQFAATDELRTYPLGEGRVVQFTLPKKFTTLDLAKLSCHLATYCEDFDPTRPTAGVLAIGRTDERKS